MLKLIEFSQAVSSQLDLEQLDYKRGTVEGAIYFADGSRLEFTERIVIDRARPIKRQYRYQYVRGESRYSATTMRLITRVCPAFRITNMLGVRLRPPWNQL